MAFKAAIALGLSLTIFNCCLNAQSKPAARQFKIQAETNPSPDTQPDVNQATNAFVRYSSYRIRSVNFKNAERTGQDDLLKTLPVKAGDSLDRDKIHAAIQQLFATGRFRTIAAEVAPYADRSLDLNFVVDEKLFIGSIVVYGAPRPPTENQLVNGSKLQLGQEFDEDAVAAGIERMKRLLAENGYFFPTLRLNSALDPQHQRINLSFVVDRGERARLGQVIVKGDPGYPEGKIRSITKLHAGQPVSAGRLSRGLNRLRQKYQKTERLEAQVAVVDRNYQSDSNTLDYIFQVDRGPLVDVRLEGARLRRGLIKKYVPIYEEGAVDEDLLSEGRKNLRDYFQTKGYFDANVTSSTTNKSGMELVVFDVDRGVRHTFNVLAINGNKYFPAQSLRERMAIQPADRLQRRGVFSTALLNHDLSAITGLYQANGFQQVSVASRVTDDYKGKTGHLRVDIDIKEGPQTLVHSVQITGNTHYSNDTLLNQLSTIPGQPFSSFLLANDRDSVVSYYFDRGFPDVQVETVNQPAPDQPNRQDVSFKVTEGLQVFVDKILISGLHYTQPFIVNRELQVKEGDPMSQSKILDSQRRLYDLSIFNQVDVAPSNPDGAVTKKDLMMQLEEAKRYTFDYGVGIQVQTGALNSDCQKINPNPNSPQVCNPNGTTGFSPLGTFGITRSNFRGRDDTITLRTNVGRLEQRVLVSYEQPHWLNRNDLTLTVNGFYDSTQDVLTFSSERLEGSVQALQQWRKGETFLYKFSYRRVQVDENTLQISPDLIPLLSRPVRVGLPSFSYVRDHRDDPLDSHRGMLNAVDFGVAYKTFGSQADYTRLFIENSSYYAFAKNKNISGRSWVFARSTRIGVENPLAAANTLEGTVPLPERFFTGGSNSHRGFGINEAGPRDPVTGFPLGGDGLFLNNLELRTPSIQLPYIGENLGLVLFHDAGNVFATAGDIFPSLGHWSQPHPETCIPHETTVTASTPVCDFNYISQAVGLGVRYRTPIGPVRVDFGYNLNAPVFPVRNNTIIGPYEDHTPRFNFYFSIGQTF